VGHRLDRAEKHLDDWGYQHSYPAICRRRRIPGKSCRERTEARRMAEAMLKATQLLHLTESQLKKYGDRLPIGDEQVISQQRARMSEMMGEQGLKDYIVRLDEEISKLEETAKTLTQVAKDSHKPISNEAYDARIGGEKGLLDAEYLVNPTNTDLHAIEDAPEHLKSLGIASESDLKEPNILAGTDSLIETNAAIE